jgi:hypothetical protein
MTTTGRRGFFTHSLDELVAVFDESRGRRSFKLTELASLADGTLGRLVPVIMDASKVTADRGRFVVRSARGQTVMLFQVGSVEEDVWSRMNGQSSIEQIANAIAIEWNETREVAFARTRNVFLQLAGRQICIPRNPIQS